MVQRGPAACDPADIQEVVLDGTALGVAEVIAVARLRRPVSIAPKARHRVDCCRRMIDLLLERREKIYGLTTGFGKLRDVTIQGKDVQRLQINLIRSHACGVGEPFDEDVVRAALLLRANTLCRGNSGIRNESLSALGPAPQRRRLSLRPQAGFGRRLGRPGAPLAPGAGRYG